MKILNTQNYSELIKKISQKKSALFALVIVAGAGIIGGITTKHALIAATPEPEIPLTLQDQTHQTKSILTDSTKPVTLSIPSLGINATIQHTGVSIHNTLAVPTNYSDVGWYRYGPTPGDDGNAIINGHRDNGFGLPAVFKRINELQPGDDIFVINNSGQKLKFEVNSIKVVPENSPIDYLFSKTEGSHLTLISCDGVWQAEKNMYADRIIVTATYMGTEPN